MICCDDKVKKKKKKKRKCMINHWFMSEDLITMNKCKGIQEKKRIRSNSFMSNCRSSLIEID
jgi:hypothetical protein